EGKQASPVAITAYYRSLAGKVKAEDTLLCYYTGHGDLHPREGHRLTMTHGTLSRKDLRTQAEALKPRLVVLLTDCCAQAPPGGARARALPSLPRATWPVMDCLFFHHDGLTDINGCQNGAFAWNYFDDKENPKGGSFTLALAPLLCARPAE